MRRSLFGLVLALVFIPLSQLPAQAQGGTTSTISGVAVDKDGGLVPGATVTIKNTATGRVFTTTTSPGSRNRGRSRAVA